MALPWQVAMGRLGRMPVDMAGCTKGLVGRWRVSDGLKQGLKLRCAASHGIGCARLAPSRVTVSRLAE